MVGVALAAIGKSRLLATKKFKQFEGEFRGRKASNWILIDLLFSVGLCEENLKPTSDGPQTLSGDLQGFWDMMLLQVDNVDESFVEIQKCRENGWKVSQRAHCSLVQRRNLFFFVHFRNQKRQRHSRRKAVASRNVRSRNHRQSKAKPVFRRRKLRQSRTTAKPRRNVKSSAKNSWR